MLQSQVAMKKLLVTHSNPDLDAVTAIWLFKRFINGWEDTDLSFVPAGEVYQKAGIHTEVIHVDTGMGEFDHHQDNRDTCAGKLVFEYLVQYKDDAKNAPHGQVRHFSEDALSRMITVINDIDHFRQVDFPDANADHYQFLLVDILDGLNLVFSGNGNGDIELVDFAVTALDGIYRVFQNKVAAEHEIDEGQKTEVQTNHGKAIGFEISNDAVLDISQKQGYVIAVRKDPRRGYVRIKSLPGRNIDLKPVYERLKKEDTKATWFLHASHAMVLNGSTKNPKMRPSSLTLTKIMNIIEEIFSMS
jgi:hypothetical protein